MSRLRLFVALDEEETTVVGRIAIQHRSVVVVRRSLDSRRGRPIGYDLELAIDEADPFPRLPPPLKLGRPWHVVVIGAGPAGTFAALRLVEAGAQVTVVEQGKPVQPRRHDLASLTQRGDLHSTSNYCFGEGGAGTFSDGKLYTRVKDRAGVGSVLQTLVEHGAEASIEIDSRPHIGSNRLPPLLVSLRETLQARGVRYHWEQSVSALLVNGTRVGGVRCLSGLEIAADATLLAVGHSARSLYESLHAQGVALVAKPFAMGARIEHPQSFVDRAQYGRAYEHPRLPAAFYHVTAQVAPTGAGNRGVYSFCMCPGGWVVNSSTEPGRLCTNGMSLSRRDSPRANAALVVTVEPSDYQGRYGEGPLAGLAMQRAVEEQAFALGGGSFVAPAQRLDDFVAKRPSTRAEASSYRPSIVPGDVRSALPTFVGDALALALRQFDRTMRGFFHSEAQLVGVETRTSSPVRIVRNEDGQSPSHAGLFPVGEGAGFAGGIVSAAIDGLLAADRILSM